MNVLAVCHVHSEWSYDGSWSLQALASKFSGRGIRILMMTEHDRGFTPSRWQQYRDSCASVSSHQMLVVPGIEYSDPANRVHVLVWGQIPFLGEGRPTAQLLRAVADVRGVAVLAHPSRKDAWQCFLPDSCHELLGIEVWNRKYDGWAPSKKASALLNGGAALPFVGLDFHTQRQSFPLAMALNIDTEISEEAVLHSLKSGRCSPQAFGIPLTQTLFRKVVPILNIAERSRRRAASIVKYSRKLAL